MSAVAQPEPIKVGFHIGNVITFLSHLYGNGFAVLREAVQNAIDEGATEIFVEIDCLRRFVKIFDNGRGASLADITEKFGNIGLSLKKGIENKIGQKGIGNLAGLAVAQEWKFLSRRGGSPFYAYTFDRKELEKGDQVKVLSEEVQFKSISKSLQFEANSLLWLSDVAEITLKQLGDQDTIERTLREAFNTKLKMNNINLRVSYNSFKRRKHDFVVRPLSYRGAEMDVVNQDTPKGYVDFAFFHSPSPIEKPSILVQHQGVYSIPLVNFFKMKIFPASIEHLFFRGYFEGEIRLGFCTINGSRTGFEHDGDLKIFVEAVTAFAEDVLKPIIEQFEQANREERWKRIADGVLKTVRDFFKKNPSMVPPTLKTLVFKTGSGDDHSTTTIPGTGVHTTERGPNGGAKKPTEKPILPPDALKKQKAASTEAKKKGATSSKPKGRTVNFSEGLGIQFVFPDPENDGFLWHSRTSSEGVVQINVVNNEFLEAERRGQAVTSRYLMTLLQKELTCASLTPKDAECFDAGFEIMMEHFWRASL